MDSAKKLIVCHRLQPHASTGEASWASAADDSLHDTQRWDTVRRNCIIRINAKLYQLLRRARATVAVGDNSSYKACNSWELTFWQQKNYDRKVPDEWVLAKCARKKWI